MRQWQTDRSRSCCLDCLRCSYAGKAKLYKPNEEEEVVKDIMALDSALCKKAMEKAAEEEKAKQEATIGKHPFTE